jgi:hypothetical protein
LAVLRRSARGPAASAGDDEAVRGRGRRLFAVVIDALGDAERERFLRALGAEEAAAVLSLAQLLGEAERALDRPLTALARAIAGVHDGARAGHAAGLLALGHAAQRARTDGALARAGVELREMGGPG